MLWSSCKWVLSWGPLQFRAEMADGPGRIGDNYVKNHWVGKGREHWWFCLAPHSTSGNIAPLGELHPYWGFSGGCQSQGCAFQVTVYILNWNQVKQLSFSQEGCWWEAGGQQFGIMWIWTIWEDQPPWGGSKVQKAFQSQGLPFLRSKHTPAFTAILQFNNCPFLCKQVRVGLLSLATKRHLPSRVSMVLTIYGMMTWQPITSPWRPHMSVSLVIKEVWKTFPPTVAKMR